MIWPRPHRRITRAALVIGVIAGSYALIALATHLYARFVLLPKIQASAETLTRFEPRILADLKLLANHPIYEDRPRERNAERFLSGFISWSGEHIDSLDDLNHELLIELMNAHEHALRDDDEWAALLDDDRLEEIDLQWVDQLLAYDHIDFGTHPVFADLLSRVEHTHGLSRIEIAASLPIPNMTELRFAALARVAQLQLEDHLPEARTLYRHVSYLLSTSDSLVGSLAAAVMLQNEKSLGLRTESSWPVIESDRINAMKRTAWAWVGIERVSARQGSLGAFEPYLNRSTNACAGVLELFGLESILQDYFGPTTFLEFDLRARLATQSRVQRKIYEKCDHPELTVFFTPVADEDSPLMLTRRQLNPAHIPFLRRLVGLSLLVLAEPNAFRLYEEDPRQPASASNSPETQ